MLFGVEFDDGDNISGYIVPDGHSDIASITVTEGGEFSFTMPCNELRPSVRDARRHDTGKVGFRIDGSIIPGLVTKRNLEIRDAKSGILIYRRLPYMPPVNKKVMRLETQIIPAVAFDRHVSPLFHYVQGGLDRFGHETALQSFHLAVMASIYLSGRIMIRNYEEFFEKDFHFVGFFYDPYYEMASRIYMISRISKTKNVFLSERDMITFSPAAEYFQDIDLSDQDDVRRFCKRMPARVQDTMRSPYVRQLACTQPEQLPDKSSIASAIDILSRFTVVGHISNTLPYLDAVSELLEVPSDYLKAPVAYSPIQELANNLKEILAVERLLEEDLIFDHYLRQAINLQIS
ncbi:hypothetical protein ACFFP0_30580 [Rhizobium puerariae]|uniref:Uncharacterized protein n=1 Tax=Rhizobium puerariae TaxID=1585791 RepID=A0ABV6ARF9_9HYPH